MGAGRLSVGDYIDSGTTVRFIGTQMDPIRQLVSIGSTPAQVRAHSTHCEWLGLLGRIKISLTGAWSENLTQSEQTATS